ncbi:hypothetical protein E2562_033615 [Oryza meyeriana var. granulata]|uniref:Uncharacterized protein n=1 Tax=Oryza meyeriana var. granulata TaxID=110450 RepID=A0A6G1FF78_9ORYZ|nr:hypothetical protein E2562_033615 [Oryza meyeriana var. granulata]
MSDPATVSTLTEGPERVEPRAEREVGVGSLAVNAGHGAGRRKERGAEARRDMAEAGGGGKVEGALGGVQRRGGENAERGGVGNTFAVVEGKEGTMKP